MKLTTVMIAAAALTGAATIATGASAATVFEQYLYSGGSLTDQLAFSVTNDSGSAYTDVKIGTMDFGPLAAGFSTGLFLLGDPTEGGSTSALVTVNTGTQILSGTFTTNFANGGDADVAIGPTSLGEVGAAAVPEPGVWALLLAGFAGLGGALRLSRRKVAVAA